MKAFDEFLTKYFPEGNRIDAFVMYAYTVAQTLVHVLKACGDDLTRENVMKQAASIKDLELGGMLPGIKINTSATDFAPISAVQLMRFKGEAWDRFGEHHRAPTSPTDGSGRLTDCQGTGPCANARRGFFLKATAGRAISHAQH